MITALSSWCLLSLPNVSAADGGWRVLALEEDDIWAPGNKDRHYTHGARLDAVSTDLRGGKYLSLFDWLPLFVTDESHSRRVDFMVGQNIYTPENLVLKIPAATDRPYAGWLYIGLGIIQNTGPAQLDRFALRLGVVGPSSGAATTQISFHTIIDAGRPKGWAYQISDEPAFDLYVERKWRARNTLFPDFGIGVDVIPQIGLRIGNVYDYVSIGALFRLGRNLLIDYGPPHIDENLGSVVLNPEYADSNWAWYFFAGSEARLIGRNIFLDGNLFTTSARIARNDAVADLEAGLALIYGDLRLGYTIIYRTKEFPLQSGYDHFGSIDLGFRISY